MGYFSDSDSETFSVSSHEGSEHMTIRSCNPKKSTPNTASTRSVSNTTTRSQCRGKSPTRSVTQGSNDDRLAAIMSLRAEIGMDQDPEFLKKEQKKAATKKKQEEERVKLAGMSTEERVKHERSNVSDMMNKIRQKREQSKRNLLKDVDAGENSSEPAPKLAGMST